MATTSLAGRIDQWHRELKDEGETVSEFEHCVRNQVQKFFTGDGDPKAIANTIAASFCRNPDYADPSQTDAPEEIDDSRQPWQAWSDFIWIILNTALFSDDTGLHKSLAQLVVEMMLHPDATNETGHDIVSINSTEEFPKEHMYIMKPGEVVVDPFGKSYFRDLPEFLMELGCFFQGPLSFANSETGEVTKDGWNEWARINSFTAHLAIAGRQFQSSTLGVKSEGFGSKTMTFTLQCPDLDDFSDIRAVAHWLAIDGDAMYRNDTWGNWKPEEIADPEFLSRHRRWQIWKGELQRVAQDEAASERNVEAAKEALQTMDKIERDAA
ncbi:hypothetical protein Q7P37_010071 [Cladosporium fusiforme]